jgi:biotin operon repressor
LPTIPPHKRVKCPKCQINEIRTLYGAQCNECRIHPGWHLPRPEPAAPPVPAVTGTRPALVDELPALLKKPITLDELAGKTGASRGQVLDAIDALKGRGINVQQFGERWSLEKAPDLGSAVTAGAYVSRPDGRYRFGWLSDNHLCSKYARLDVLRDIYRRFEGRDLDRIFNAGNWIDGEARFNKYDLLVHGMDAQIRYLRDEYPIAPNGLVTYAVAGDDHEGWYCQREGVDIGKYAESELKAAGRSDWVNLGYMEAFVPLQHASTGAVNQLHVVHPGGGSSYATSYTVQKLVESYAGGSKPAVMLAGHYHKLEFINVRNVWCVQTGCTQDQTPFARKKRLHFALGGGICELEQDPESGAIVGCSVEMFCYFDRGFYQNRWSHSGPIALPEARRGQ